jgi:hypothetical protein
MNKQQLIISVRDFIQKIGQTVITLLRVLTLSTWRLPKIKKEKSDQNLIILGNGPSLNELLKKHKIVLESTPKLAVNFFARTEEYITLKPAYYVIISPEYFRRESKKEWAQDRNHTLQTIADKTTWPMMLLLPNVAKNHPLVKSYFGNHSSIQIRYINTTPVEGFKWFRHSLQTANLGIPRPHNVLIPSIWFAIKSGFKTVYLFGADHSWLKDIWVNDHNEVLLSQKHFYDNQTTKEKSDKNKPTPQPMYHGTSARTRRLHEVLHKFMISFEAYWSLRDYAESQGTHVINMTPDSYIDAFARKSTFDEK